jgi:hypothetical protein
MANIEITWQAFGNKHYSNKQSKLVSSASFNCDDLNSENESGRLLICNMVYAATNSYGEFGGAGLWESIKEVLPIERTHTALSIGDKITIDYVHTYIVAEVGFVKIAGLVD